MKGYIYSISELPDNNIIYIGSSIYPDERLQSHKVGARIGDTPFYKYLSNGNINFCMDIIEEIEIDKKNELLKHEIYWIHQFIEWGFNLKNSVLYRTYNKSEYSPTPVRIGDVKPFLESEAKELGISLHRLIINILNNYVKIKKPS